MANTCTIKTETCGFRCTGYEGAHIWKQLHNTVKKIECESCKEHGEKLISGAHDHVTVGLGGKPFNSKNYKKFVDEINCVWNRCKSDGRC